jgi:signal transduction histidine kinase
MSFRALQTFLFAIVFSVVVFFVYELSSFFESKMIALLSPSDGPTTISAIHFLMIEEFAILVMFTAVLLLLTYLVLSTVVAQPLRKLVKAMNSFAVDGSSVKLPSLKGSVDEIKSLGETFSSFATKVVESHKKDMDISRVKSDFISTAAHQLRTPLTGIRWALEALENEQLTESQKTLVKSAVDKSHDLVAIVGTLLDISSIESGKYKYNFAPVDLAKLLSEVAQDFSPLAQKSNISLFYAKDENVLPLVRADRDRVKWVLNNLVENAIRYTPAPGTVLLTTESNGGMVYVRVKDSGIGIQEQDRGNIFERFYRAGNAITKENQGNGLGLYIARTIATDHGGDLNFVDNKEVPGTTFVLSLPVGQ